MFKYLLLKTPQMFVEFVSYKLHIFEFYFAYNRAFILFLILKHHNNYTNMTIK